MNNPETKKLILAPMATLSHAALRNAIYKFGGCDEYYCEMIHATSLLAGGHFEKYYIMTSPEPEKMVWQLTDTIPEPIIKATEIVRDLGGIGVDINMGCPAPDIYNHGAGMAWMNKPLTETAAMLEKISSKLQNQSSSCRRLSVKCRLGEDNFTDESFFAFIDMLVSSGVEQIVLHPRTRKQKYSRSARWNYVKELCSYCAQKYPDNKISIIGNGDISDVKSAIERLEIAPDCDGVMLARYAVQKPWLFSQLARALNNGEKSTASLDLYDFTAEYLSLIRENQPVEFWKTRTQRFFAYFCDNFSFALYLKGKLLHAENHEEQLKILAEYFEKVPEEKVIEI